MQTLVTRLGGEVAGYERIGAIHCSAAPGAGGSQCAYGERTQEQAARSAGVLWPKVTVLRVGQWAGCGQAVELMMESTRWAPLGDERQGQQARRVQKPIAFLQAEPRRGCRSVPAGALSCGVDALLESSSVPSPASSRRQALAGRLVRWTRYSPPNPARGIRLEVYLAVKVPVVGIEKTSSQDLAAAHSGDDARKRRPNVPVSLAGGAGVKMHCFACRSRVCCMPRTSTITLHAWRRSAQGPPVACLRVYWLKAKGSHARYRVAAVHFCPIKSRNPPKASCVAGPTTPCHYIPIDT